MCWRVHQVNITIKPMQINEFMIKHFSFYLVRNACVNLGIDPDTVDGVTENVRVFVDDRPFKQRKPRAQLADAGFRDGGEIRIEPI